MIMPMRPVFLFLCVCWIGLAGCPAPEEFPEEDVDAGSDVIDEPDVADDPDVTEEPDATDDLDASDDPDVPDVSDDPDVIDEPTEDPFPFLIHPGLSRATVSHLAWASIDDATLYEVAVYRLTGSEFQSVHTEETPERRAQLPREYRNDPEIFIGVTARDGAGEILQESDLVGAAPDVNANLAVCEGYCNGRNYEYVLRVYGDNPTFVRIESGYQSMRAVYGPSFNPSIVPPGGHYAGPFVVPSDPSEVVRDSDSPQCAPMMVGDTYYLVTKNGGPWQPAILSLTETAPIGNDAESTCGNTSTVSGLAMLFNTTSSISPSLTCQPACGSDYDVDGDIDDQDWTDTGWGWDVWDDAVFPDPFVIGGGAPVSPGGLGWADDVIVGDLLKSLSAYLHTVDLGDLDLELRDLSLRSVLNPEEAVGIDIERLVLERESYVDEVLDELDDDLYVLNQYFGGTWLHMLAVIHADE